MSLDATTALVDLPGAKAFLLIPGAENDALIEAAINVASAACEKYCERLFRERTVTERVEGRCGEKLPLYAVPIKASAAVSVTVDGVVQTVWRSESDGSPADFDVIARPYFLHRVIGWRPATSNPYNVLLSYTGGYPANAIPAEVQQACLYVVQKVFRDGQRQLAEVAQVNTPMGGVTLLDNALPRMARMLLGPYQLPEVH